MLVADLAGRPGLSLRVGQMGVVAGLDWSAFLAMLPAGVDRERALALARFYESGLIEGSAELIKKG